MERKFGNEENRKQNEIRRWNGQLMKGRTNIRREEEKKMANSKRWKID